MRSRKACIEQLAYFRNSGKLKQEEVELINDVSYWLYQDKMLSDPEITNPDNSKNKISNAMTNGDRLILKLLEKNYELEDNVVSALKGKVINKDYPIHLNLCHTCRKRIILLKPAVDGRIYMECKICRNRVNV